MCPVLSRTGIAPRRGTWIRLLLCIPGAVVRGQCYVYRPRHPLIRKPCRNNSFVPQNFITLNETSQTDGDATVLALLGVVTLIVRYRGQSGGVIQCLRRDGGMHYLTLLGRYMISSCALHTSDICDPIEQL
jgi:hypothetical protein